MFRFKASLSLFVLTSLLAPTRGMAQDAGPRGEDTRQIDRFEAIHWLQSSLKSHPKDTAGWIVLGELSFEVARDLSSGDDEPYYQMAADAYGKALALQPENATLRAAAEYAQDQLVGVRQWDKQRRSAARAYVEAREHKLTAAKFSSAVLVYPPERASAPVTSPRAVTVSRETVPTVAALPVPAASETAPAAPAPAAVPPEPSPAYTYAVYQPYYVQSGQPYAYASYSGSSVYATPAYAYSGAAPGMHGAHRRRSER
jgi:hypothetical protein